MLKRMLVISAVGLVGVIAVRQCVAGAPTEIDITGSYTCKGRTTRGVTYQADVFISKMKDAYKIHWLMLGGGEYSGVGVRRGEYLAVAYQHDAGNPGVYLYHITKTYLIGSWTTEEGEGRVAAEMLTRD